MGEAVLQRFGGVDVLVNSAGINVPKRSFETLSIEDWHAVLGTNLHGATIACARSCRPCVSAAPARSSTSIGRRQGRARLGRTGLRLVEVRVDGADGADQCGRAQQRHPGVLDLPSGRQHAVARQAAAAADTEKRARRCCSPRTLPRARGWWPPCIATCRRRRDLVVDALSYLVASTATAGPRPAAYWSPVVRGSSRPRARQSPVQHRDCRKRERKSVGRTPKSNASR